MDDEELQQGYFQQDGATAHCTVESIALLREFFDDRIISRNTETPFPPRSCDLTPCDFFLWPYLKNSIFRTPLNNIPELRIRIENKCAEINNNPHILQNVFRGFLRRINLCIEQNGGHIHQFL